MASVPLKQACVLLLAIGLSDSNYVSLKRVLPRPGHSHLAAALAEYFQVAITHNPHEACRTYLSSILTRTRFYSELNGAS